MKDSAQVATKRIALGLLIIGRKRPGFDQEWNQTMTRGAREALAALEFDCISDVPVVDDVTIGAAIAKIRQAGCDALVVLQPSLGNGQLSLAVMQQWGQPVVLWATPERQDNPKASSCSLVAQHLWASIFRMAKHPFEMVYGDPGDARVRSELARAVALCKTRKIISEAKLGTIGGNAPGFLAMAPDTFAMKRQLGVQLAMLSLTQFIDRVNGIDDVAARNDVELVRGMKWPMRDVTADDLALQSRYYLSMKQLIEEESLQAISMQDWPELPNNPGGWPYMAMSRLADEGFPISMEGDADGAILCLMGKHLGMGLAFITDWLEHDDDSIMCWHAGSIPPSMCPPIGKPGGPTLAKHFNIERPMVMDGSLRTGEPVTIGRLWRCDDRYHMTAFEGKTIPMPRSITGNSAMIEVDGGDVRNWFDTLCHAGFPHHPVVFYGRHLETLRRMARMLNVNWLAKS